MRASTRNLGGLSCHSACVLLGLMGQVTIPIGHKVAKGVDQSRRLRVLDAVRQNDLDGMIQARRLHVALRPARGAVGTALATSDRRQARGRLRAPCILASPLAHRTPSTSRHSVTSY